MSVIADFYHGCRNEKKGWPITLPQKLRRKNDLPLDIFFDSTLLAPEQVVLGPLNSGGWGGGGVDYLLEPSQPPDSHTYANTKRARTK